MLTAEQSNWPVNNSLLTALPRSDFERLDSQLERVPLTVMQVVLRGDRPISHVYFPTSSIISLTLAAREGTVEVGMVGNEGMAGLPLFLGAERSPCTATCQLDGEAMRLSAASFLEAIKASQSLQSVFHRYAAFLLVQSFHSTACNRLHSAEQRMCRWLLMTHNRAGSDQFPLKQVFLARMLGVRRPTVSIVANAIQKAGLIRYSRGKITILDRPGLEAASCECYGVVRKELKRLLG